MTSKKNLYWNKLNFASCILYPSLCITILLYSSLVQAQTPPVQSTTQFLQPAVAVVSKEALGVVTKALKELRKEYSDAVIAKIKDTLSQKEILLQQIIKLNNSKLFSDITPESASGSTIIKEDTSGSKMIEADTSDALEISSGPLFFDFVEVEPDSAEVVDDEFSRASIAYKKTELVHNRSLIIQYLANQDDSDKAARLLAQDLSINDQSVS